MNQPDDQKTRRARYKNDSKKKTRPTAHKQECERKEIGTSKPAETRRTQNESRAECNWIRSLRERKEKDETKH